MSTIAELAERVAALERARAQENHQHNYRYSKSISRGHFTGWSGPFWSWACLNDEGEIDRACPQPSGGTNSQGALPDHFPYQLR